MKKYWILLVWIGVSQSIFVLPSVASAKEGLPHEASATAFFPQADLEKKKIDFLLHEIEQLKGAKFWRNGLSYAPSEAADYLRMKMKWNDRARPIKSAKDFIERIGSKSSISGKPYLLQMEDGKKVEMKAFLEDRLVRWKE